MNKLFIPIGFVLIACSKFLLASESSLYEYFDSNGEQYNFAKDYKFFHTGDVFRDIKKCEANDCIFIDKTMLFRPPSNKLSEHQESYNFEGQTIFIKPLKYKLLSQEIDAFSINIESQFENYTFIFNEERGVIAFELRLESFNYKTGASFISNYFLILAGEKGIFSKE